MIKLRLGSRKSKLAIQQAELVKNKIEKDFNYQVEIIPISSIGDKDQKSQLHAFRGQGVFTSTIEQELLSNTIDIAVHSLKDLPIIDNDGLSIRAYMKRHSVGDSLLIKKEFILSVSPLKLMHGTRIATGSPRRQSQLINYDRSLTVIDIRGNINTRISRLESGVIDGLVVATAVFDRMDIPLSKNIVHIKLDLDRFPSAAGQGVIAVQTRKDEFIEFKSIGDNISKEAVVAERMLLASIGEGCDVAVGISAIKCDDIWQLFVSIPLSSTFANPLKYYMLSGKNLAELIEMVRKSTRLESNKIDLSDSNDKIFRSSKLEYRKIILARDELSGNAYSELLDNLGFITANMPVLEYITNYEQLNNSDLLDAWYNTEWIVISSQRAVPFLKLLSKYHPRTSFRVAAIGQITARVARRNNLPIHFVAKGNMNDFKVSFAEMHDLYPGEIVYLGGKHISNSTEYRFFEVYEARTKELISPFKPDITIVYSRRSAELIVNKFGKDYPKLWIAIGNTTATYFSSNRMNHIIADNPTPVGVRDALMRFLN